MKSGQNNNGYVANAADYSPPSQTTLLLRNGSSNTSSDTTYYPNGQVPSVNSTLTRNSRSTTVDSRQDVGLPNVHGSFNSLQNSILSEYTIHLSAQTSPHAMHPKWTPNTISICRMNRKFDSSYMRTMQIMLISMFF